MSKKVIDARNALLTPPLARILAAKVELDFEFDEADLWAEMHPDQSDSWENCALPVQKIGGGDDDFRFSRRTFLGWPLELNPHLDNSVIQIRKDREVVAEIVNLGLAEVANA